jgi:hypothetical protein
VSNSSKGSQVDSVYLDFAKAFDSVVHSKLLHKLVSFGISGNLMGWIESFLTNRVQSVRVGLCRSDWSPVLSGVPQGSVLGPLLFILFINDLTDCCIDSCKMFVFADDAKCFTCVKSNDDCVKLQKVLFAIENWSIIWQLPLSLNKCKVISFHGSNEPIVFQYSILNYCLSTVELISDLGVILCHQIYLFRDMLAIFVAKLDANRL